MPEIPNVGVHLDRSTMSWSRRIDAPIERVWEAVTLKEHLDQWMVGLEAPQMELKLGGRHFWWTGEGVVSEFEPLRAIRLTHGDGFPFMRYELKPDGDGTLFAFSDRMNRGERCPDTEWEETENGWRQRSEDRPTHYQPGGEGTHWAGVAAGWHSFMDSLEAYVTGDSDGHLGHERLSELYAEWQSVHWGKGGDGWKLNDPAETPDAGGM